MAGEFSRFDFSIPWEVPAIFVVALCVCLWRALANGSFLLKMLPPSWTSVHAYADEQIRIREYNRQYWRHRLVQQDDASFLSNEDRKVLVPRSIASEAEVKLKYWGLLAVAAGLVVLLWSMAPISGVHAVGNGQFQCGSPSALYDLDRFRAVTEAPTKYVNSSPHPEPVTGSIQKLWQSLRGWRVEPPLLLTASDGSTEICFLEIMDPTDRKKLLSLIAEAIEIQFARRVTALPDLLVYTPADRLLAPLTIAEQLRFMPKSPHLKSGPHVASPEAAIELLQSESRLFQGGTGSAALAQRGDPPFERDQLAFGRDKGPTPDRLLALAKLQFHGIAGPKDLDAAYINARLVSFVVPDGEAGPFAYSIARELPRDRVRALEVRIENLRR